ncbi:scavenger mRNA decapping enzyme [Aaosphaeria arxii CBS 175.79]|uniref:Scavenger mRNA decapping enzyme n=1 Tax=Aaosphaeria arxii CBS 175.79 TaxID=1450172 RepID=A0A6A5Y467_9PLEO|nr:scavenger mRNA decapping enzyme [Aaosphaeria arxii CBS 175.79]KAF2020069.1 scavenger mRNA decapping enzyme [Aaosphaeria arxii CBS 175.79]
MTSTTPPDVAAHVESLIPQFSPTRLLNADQAGRRISLLGTIASKPALLIAERAAFSTAPSTITTFPSTLTGIKNLGANDIYAWFLAHSSPSLPLSPSTADLKLNLIYPCTPQHIKKYTKQPLRVVTETPAIYAAHVRPYMAAVREAGRLNWVFNILDGVTEQDDIIYREKRGERDGFLILPDLNWDRKTMESLHLLGLVDRRDLWSVRDLKKGDGEWVRHVRERLVEKTVELYGGQGVERDMLKMYVHYQPTYYHFHVHVVHVGLEAGNTQATGKALGLENVVSVLENLRDREDGVEASMADVDLTYHVGEQSELWEKIWLPLKEGRAVEL